MIALVTEGEGLRERKRLETQRRIAHEALILFQKQGYDATTLEAVAAAADVSARTLYHYFATKDALLHYWNGSGGFLKALGPTIVALGTTVGPLATVRRALLDLIPEYETEQSLSVARIFADTESLRAGKQAFFVEMEQVIYGALSQSWPQPERAFELRTVAMLSAGALRLARAFQMETNAGLLVDHVERFIDAISSAAA